MKSEIVLDFETDEFESALELSLTLQAKLSAFLLEHGVDVFYQLWLPVVEYQFYYRVSCTPQHKESYHEKQCKSIERTDRANYQLVIPGWKRESAE